MDHVLRNFQRQPRRCTKSMDALLVRYSLSFITKHLPAIFHCTWEYSSVEMVILYSSPIIQTLDFLLIFLAVLFRPEGCWEHGKFSRGCIAERKTTIPKNDKEGHSKHRYIVTSGIFYDAFLADLIVLISSSPFPHFWSNCLHASFTYLNTDACTQTRFCTMCSHMFFSYLFVLKFDTTAGWDGQHIEWEST